MYQNLQRAVSDSQLLLQGSHILPPADDINNIKKVTSLSYGVVATKSKIKTDHKAFNVRLTKYKAMTTSFDHACNNFFTSFKAMKTSHTDTLAEKNNIDFEEFYTTVSTWFYMYIIL